MNFSTILLRMYPQKLSCCIHRVLENRKFSNRVHVESVSQHLRKLATTLLLEWVDRGKGHPLKSACLVKDIAELGVITDPSTGNALAAFVPTTRCEINKIISTAKVAQQEWSKIPCLEKSKRMHKAADLIRSELEWFSLIETLDSGKPLWEARGDIIGCADSIDLFAGFIPTLSGVHVPVAPNAASFYYTRREPYGICAGYGAWNFPLQMAVWKSAPALAAGNAFVFKPSPLTPLTALRLADIYKSAGCPEGLFSVVLGDVAEGQALVNHPGISKVSFTGSEIGGKAVLTSAAQRVIPSTLELGGKSPLIIMPDAALDEAVKGTIIANFYSQGQVCSNAARVFVHERIFDEFENRLLEEVNKLRVGDPFSPDTCVGAMISRAHRERVLAHVSGALDEGAVKISGGVIDGSHLDSHLSNGNFMAPCLLTRCTDSMVAVREEIFGPVLSLLKFSTEEEVIRRANDSPYGLAGGVFTQNLTTAHRVAELLKCGSVYVNNFNVYPPGIPFGGYKLSGFGRENGLETLTHYTQTKAVYVEGGLIEYPFPTSQ